MRGFSQNHSSEIKERGRKVAMTKAKKMLGMVMAALLCFALTPMAAFASATPMDTGDEPQGSITIQQASVGETYTVYKMLDLKYNEGKTSFSYTIADGWDDFFTENDVAKDYVNVETISGTKYVSWKSDKKDTEDQIVDAKIFTDAAIAYATDAEITGTSARAENETLEISPLTLGYYLVSSTVGTVCSIDSTDPNATITEKNEKPTLKKEVQEDSPEGWGNKNDASIGETVNFRSTISAKTGASNYVYHDKMQGLHFVEVSKITAGEKTLTKEEDYSVVASNADDGCAFEVVFKQAFLETITTNTAIVIEYSAIVTADAAIAGTGNNNEAKLTYGNAGETEWSTTKTFVWEFGVNKVDNESAALAKPLPGAVFQLSANRELNTENKVSNPYEFVEATGKNGETVYRLATDAEKEDPTITVVTDLVTPENGLIRIQGLDADTYYLHEIAAPEGYNKLATAQVITITSSANTNQPTLLDWAVTGVTAEHPTLGILTVDVVNLSGLQLPSTGGIGTMVLYVIGGLLVLGAVVVLVRRRGSAK